MSAISRREAKKAFLMTFMTYIGWENVPADMAASVKNGSRAGMVWTDPSALPVWIAAGRLSE